MIIVGLTGGIGMGKTTAANMLRDLGYPVHDSDAAVHKMLVRGGKAVAAVAAAFPESYDSKNKCIDRRKLGAVIFKDPVKRKRLEAIIHPLVQESQNNFLRHHAGRRAKLVVLDIPLLFETGAEARVDYVICVSAPEHIQRQRVLARPGMTEAEFERRKASQMPDAEKQKRADFVVQTGQGLAPTYRDLKRIAAQLTGQLGSHRKHARSRFPTHDR